VWLWLQVLTVFVAGGLLLLLLVVAEAERGERGCDGVLSRSAEGRIYLFNVYLHSQTVRRIRPKLQPSPFSAKNRCITFTVGKSSSKLWAAYLLWQFSKKLPQVSNRPMGEKWPHLITLVSAGKSGTCLGLAASCELWCAKWLPIRSFCSHMVGRAVITWPTAARTSRQTRNRRQLTIFQLFFWRETLKKKWTCHFTSWFST
jgi:hypothetical protein